MYDRAAKAVTLAVCIPWAVNGAVVALLGMMMLLTRSNPAYEALTAALEVMRGCQGCNGC